MQVVNTTLELPQMTDRDQELVGRVVRTGGRLWEIVSIGSLDGYGKVATLVSPKRHPFERHRSILIGVDVVRTMLGENKAA